MNHFFKVQSLEQVMALSHQFSTVTIEKIPISDSFFRVLANDIDATHDIPGFRRATMDGYALYSGSTFGASESNPAWLEVTGSISMGEVPSFSIQSGQAAKISTGGMLPDGADSVVMVEHTEVIGGESAALTGVDREDKAPASDSPTVEIYKSVAPLQNVIDKDEDFKKGDKILKSGTLLRPQEVGLAAALGICELPVYKIPKVGIISTGDEIVPIDETPQLGKIRDINSYTLAGLITEAGAMPVQYGIIKDNEEALLNACLKALDETDMVLISGGSSVGNRDFTVNVFSSLQDTEILVHGISISPGKPTILAKVGIAPPPTPSPMERGNDNCSLPLGRGGEGQNNSLETYRIKPIWGLPGHVVSAMVVFKIVVLPFLRQIQGLSSFKAKDYSILIPAILTRNVASAQGRTDFIRVKLVKQLDINLKDKYQIFAEPILGKSGLIRTMVMADGLLEIGENVEGVERGDLVNIIPLRTLD